MKALTKKIIKIFLIFAIAISAIIILYNVIFPKAKIDYAYNVATELQHNENVTILDNNINAIITKIDTIDPTGTQSQGITAIFKNCDDVFDVYLKLNNNMKMGLLFNENTKNYNSYAKKLEKSFKNLNSELEDLKKYMQEEYLPYITDKTEYNEISIWTDTFKNKYFKTLNSFDLYVSNLYNIYQESAKLSLQVNEITKLQAKYASNIANGMLHKLTQLISIDTSKLLTLINKNYEDIDVSEINELVDLSGKVDFSIMVQAIINNNMAEVFSAQENAIDYQNLYNELFN